MQRASQQPWIILFGGPGREEVIFSAIKAGLQVVSILVPELQPERLKTSIERLVKLNIPMETVSKAGLAQKLEPHAGKPMLSLGFPFILPAAVLSLFPLRLNIHPTLLPAYRGPMSGAFILINGEKETGSTVHVLEAGADTGDIIAQSRIPLSRFDTVRSMQRKVYASEPALFLEALTALDAGITPQKQDESQASMYPQKRTPEDSCIDPEKSLLTLYDYIRACDPEAYPAFFMLEGQKVCIRLWRPDRPVSDGDDML